jgi:activator of HSP90 ATPase
MTRTIRQSVLLEAAPDALFDTYLDRRGHQAVTGGKVSISARPGSRFSAFDDMITGRTLEVLPKRLIVQRWRCGGWQADDPDSTLVLAFSPGRAGTGRYYWRPWRAYLKAKKAS